MGALSEIWAGLGAGNGPRTDVEWTGPACALPSAFRVTELASGAVAAATLAAARLAGLKSGRTHHVQIDRRHAALAFRSERHFARVGTPTKSPWDEASGYYLAACGGTLQVHCNFPHHRAGVAAELGVEDNPGPGIGAHFAKAIAKREATELERALTQRGMVAAMLRTGEEWLHHEHGQVTAGLPVIEVIPLGDAPVRALPKHALPMGGLRVLDQTRVIAGPVCGRTLAAYGADVLRVGAAHLPVVEAILGDTNLGKRWTNLDLRRGKHAANLERLVRECDVVVQGFRPGGLDELGFGPARLAQLRPGIVVASLSAYSHKGPWAAKRGFDSLVQTATGIGAAGARAAGIAGTKPLPAQALDHGAGWMLAAGVMEALRRRATIGGSWLVRTSLVQVRNLLWNLGEANTLDLPDPEHDAGDLLVTTCGECPTRHIALPGAIDGELAQWSHSGSAAPTDDASWLPR